MEGRTIKVCGVPDILPADRIVDKVTIHFLRPRQGGGEVLRVIYPSSTKGQAFVVFEHNEVAARVAGLKQSLDIDGQQYPLTIEIVDRPDVDLPVQATLDLRMFPDQSEVRRLLRNHNFKVSELSPGKVLLDGTFLSLRAVRSQLQRQLQEARPHADRDRSVFTSNDTASGALTEDSYRAQPHVNGSHVYEREGSYTNNSQDYVRPGGSSASSDQSLSPSYHSWERSSSQNQSYLSQDSEAPQSLPNFPKDTLTGKPPLQRGTASPREISLQVDADSYRYTWTFKNDLVTDILITHGVEATTNELSGITTLTLKGKGCERAMQKLQDLISDTSSTLRTQEISLSTLSHEQRVQIGKQVQRFKDVYKVFVKQSQSSILIIGSSTDSYEMKQSLLGEPVHSYEMKQRLLGEPVALSSSVRTGRDTERGPRTRRSSSLPKQPKLRPDQHSSARLESPPVSASQAYSPSHYQGDEPRGGAAMGGSRRGSSSDRREKTTVQRPVHKADKQNMAPSSGAPMPPLKKNALNSVIENTSSSLKKKWTSMTSKR
ncbi:uncharacterized protein si:dkey-154b15.1 [Clupea harengus]|uniref:Uncharacterized protein si:dkey-154b15.1 n=1 Tax=Clupea harengus TaxID=7950 RepID=A0A6P3VJH5_CLUHA|nr:uncharacterized protein si:dkey-154b15.1 [Clupea harengus]